jgi:HEPN domain-containing protein
MVESATGKGEMANRSRDWFAQAERDLEHARHARRDGSHEWSCFACQQAAEKAVKALHLWLGQEAWGHTISTLIDQLPLDAGELAEKGRVLDNFYVATRYANGHPDGAPFEHYGPLQSETAIAHASEIVAFVRARLAKPAGS